MTTSIFTPLFLIAAFVTLRAAPLSTHAAEPASKPNILMILVDDLGYGDLSCYRELGGATDIKTPHLDQLASEGVTLPNFYANCPVCSPTRAALLSGRYQELVGVPGVVRTNPQDSWGYLAPDAVLLPNVLSKAGYHTALIGKWHLGLRPENHPKRRGFDFVHGFLGDMMDDYYKHKRQGQDYMAKDLETIFPTGHATDLFSDWAAAYLRERSEKHPDQPWFCYLAYNAPHTPIQPPADWLAKVQERAPDMEKRRAKLVALIEHMDHGIGQVLDALKTSGQADNTLVIFSSDNGGHVSVGANNGRLRGGKQDMYEGGIKVNFFARWPGKIAPGTRSERRGISMDLFPTMVEAGGGELPEGLDGVSILPTLLGQDQGRDQRTLYFSRREGNLRWMGDSSWALLEPSGLKLLKNTPVDAWEMYDLSTDPKEENNLAQKNRKDFARLATKMRAHIQRGGAVPWQKSSE